MKRLLLITLLTPASCGCAIRRHAIAYNHRVEAACVARYGKERCQPLTYPACEPAAFGSEACR